MVTLLGLAANCLICVVLVSAVMTTKTALPFSKRGRSSTPARDLGNGTAPADCSPSNAKPPRTRNAGRIGRLPRRKDRWELYRKGGGFGMIRRLSGLPGAPTMASQLLARVEQAILAILQN